MLGEPVRPGSPLIRNVVTGRLDFVPVGSCSIPGRDHLKLRAPTGPWRNRRDRTCFIKVDESQFEAALVNMTVNARDAMEGEGTLTISLTRLSVATQERRDSTRRSS